MELSIFKGRFAKYPLIYDSAVYLLPNVFHSDVLRNTDGCAE